VEKDGFFVKIDRKQYSKTDQLRSRSAEGLRLLNAETQQYIDIGLEVVGANREDSVLVTEGDSAAIFFESAESAHNFAKAVHEKTEIDNLTKDLENQCWFSIGCGYGKVILEDGVLGKDPASWGRAIAARLQAAGGSGEFLIDLDTYEALPSELREKYGPKKDVPGKDHDKPFACHCWAVISQYKQDLPPPLIEGQDVTIDEIYSLFEQVKHLKHELPSIINKLEMGELEPSAESNPKGKKDVIVDWCKNEGQPEKNKLARILREVINKSNPW